LVCPFASYAFSLSLLSCSLFPSLLQVLLQHDEATFSHVELPPEDGTGWDGSRQHGDTRAYYNRVFLPVFEQYDAAQLFG
jgi:hypothetical protein